MGADTLTVAVAEARSSDQFEGSSGVYDKVLLCEKFFRGFRTYHDGWGCGGSGNGRSGLFVRDIVSESRRVRWRFFNIHVGR